MVGNQTDQPHNGAAVVIETELSGVRTTTLEIEVEARQPAVGPGGETGPHRLGVGGQHDELGPFESRFEAPSGHSPANGQACFAERLLRNEIPPNGPPPSSVGLAPSFLKL